MATIDKSVFVKGLHGRYGKDFVVRQFNGKIVIQKPPTFSSVVSPAQAAIREKFASAIMQRVLCSIQK